jgi:hypothetical protein
MSTDKERWRRMTVKERWQEMNSPSKFVARARQVNREYEQTPWVRRMNKFLTVSLIVGGAILLLYYLNGGR